MNETQEHRMLETLFVIARHAEQINLTLHTQTPDWLVYLQRILDRLDLIADGVAPPIAENAPQGPPGPAAMARHFDVIEDEFRVLKAEVANLRNTLASLTQAS